MLRAVALLALALGALLPGMTQAGPADVIGVRVEHQPDGRYRFVASVRHADTGWDHYADRWEVVGPDGTVLATRVLRHPHVGEQPFTRGMTDVRIPDGVEEVTVRAHDSRHGLGGAEQEVALPRP